MTINYYNKAAENLIYRFAPAVTSSQLAERLFKESNAIKSKPQPTAYDLNRIRVLKEIFGAPPPQLIYTPKDPYERHIRELWADFSKMPNSINPVLQRALELAEQDSSSEKTALDLGCGNNNLIPELLKREWKVTALDSSPEALLNLLKNIQDLNLEDKAKDNLLTECEKMEKFRFPKEFHLITAKDSFPYCDPILFLDLWKKIHGHLKPGGYFAGNVFTRPLDSRREEAQRDHQIWFGDMQMMKALSKDYKVEKLEQKKIFAKDGSTINFIFRKKQPFP